MTTTTPDLIVLHEHPEWQKPLFEALTRRGVSFAPFDLTRAAFSNEALPLARLYFNQASPSAYLRGNTRAVPLALALHARARPRWGARAQRRRGLRAGVEQERAGHPAADPRHRLPALDHFQRRPRPRPVRRATSAGRRCSSRIRAAAAPASRSSTRWSRSRRSSGRIRRSGCPTTCSCSRSTCRTIPIRASCAWSSSAASSSTPCA